MDTSDGSDTFCQGFRHVQAVGINTCSLVAFYCSKCDEVCLGYIGHVVYVYDWFNVRRLFPGVSCNAAGTRCGSGGHNQGPGVRTNDLTRSHS